MTPDAITRLFKDAYDTFPPLEGKPTDDNLLAIRETLLPLLMVIPYDPLKASMPSRLSSRRPPSTKQNMATPNSYIPPASPSTIKTSPVVTTVVQVRAEAAHKSRLDDYASYEAAEHGVAKFLRNVVDEIWYNDLKDADSVEGH